MAKLSEIKVRRDHCVFMTHGYKKINTVNLLMVQWHLLEFRERPVEERRDDQLEAHRLLERRELTERMEALLQIIGEGILTQRKKLTA
uniref:Uncharacterized protein n=1 Tax=Romanomermis culicivorax TaxID=13658 RepID=A0A915J3K9_ROMCU